MSGHPRCNTAFYCLNRGKQEPFHGVHEAPKPSVLHNRCGCRCIFCRMFCSWRRRSILHSITSGKELLDGGTLFPLRWTEIWLQCFVHVPTIGQAIRDENRLDLSLWSMLKEHERNDARICYFKICKFKWKHTTPCTQKTQGDHAQNRWLSQASFRRAGCCGCQGSWNAMPSPRMDLPWFCVGMSMPKDYTTGFQSRVRSIGGSLSIHGCK